VNILFLEQHPRFGGGSERIGLSLCTHMHRAGHSTHLLYESEGDMVGAFSAVTKGVTRAPVRPLAVRHPLEAAGSIRTLLSVSRFQETDVIFTSQLGYASLLAVAASLKGPPSVVHLGLALSFPSPLYRWSQPRIAAAVAPSQPMLEKCEQLGWPASRLHMVPNGVDLERFHPSDTGDSARDSFGLPKGVPLVVYLGRLVAEKGVSTLLQAAADLKRRGCVFHLAMFGLAAGGERQALATKAAELGLGTVCFSLHEATDRPESVLAAADVAVVPSQWAEPFGLAAIEAMACGTVPVVSDAGILPQIIGAENVRCVFPQGDAAQLAETIAFILSDPDSRRSIRASCLARVREHFDISRCGEAYAKIFESVMRKP
jgi:glycosyltransferase involved in cell wall biosynthesis